MSKSALTVGELRDILDEYPDDMEVLVEGYEGGLESLERRNVVRCDIRKNCHQEIGVFGPHDYAWCDKDTDCEGLVLRR